MEKKKRTLERKTDRSDVRVIAGVAGLEPANEAVKVLCLTA